MKILNRIVRNPFFVLVVAYRNEGINLAEIRTHIKISYSYLHNIIMLFESKKWVNIDTVSRKKYIKLTENGREIAKSMDIIEKTLV